MASVVGRATAFGSRHSAEWSAHVAVDRVGRQQCLGVHGVHVVDAVQEPCLQPGAEQGPVDRIVKDDAAQRANMNRPRGRFRVVDYLGSRDGGG